MNFYRWIRPLLFCLDPERAHRLALHALRTLPFPAVQLPPTQGLNCMGLHFKHRIGLAAGFDNNALATSALFRLGFAFIECGGITPKAQKGNPKPRLFRLKEARSIINRMGFPNLGAAALAHNLKNNAPFAGPVGINLGKNKPTPLEHAADDYAASLNLLYDHADYFTINVSSPNTPGLRALQSNTELDPLLKTIMHARTQKQEQGKIKKPIVLKTTLDCDGDNLKALLDTCMQHNVAGIITSNTTQQRFGVEGMHHADEAGGLSGAAITDRACRHAEAVRKHIGSEMHLIACGGIMSARDAQARLDAGADLLQIYTALIYQGPKVLGHWLRSMQ